MVRVHSVVPAPHMNTHMPLEQTWFCPHALPHAPQLARSVWSETQRRAAPPSPDEAPAQSVSSAVQSGTHAPFWQTLPAPQERPQAPQLSRSLRGSMQRPMQARNGDGHAAGASSALSTDASFVMRPPTTARPSQPTSAASARAA